MNYFGPCADADIAKVRRIKRATDNYDRMMNGERIVISDHDHDELIDACGCRNRMNELASCQNSNRCGILDAYVAWIGNENKPADLILGANGSLYAEGSA